MRAQNTKDKKAPAIAIKKSQNVEEGAKSTNLRELYYLQTMHSSYIVACLG